jgi:AraC-like DNA-binding protein
LIFIQFIIYIIAALSAIRNFQRKASDQYSEFRRTNTAWLYSTIVFFTVLMIVFMLNGYLGLTPWSKYYYLAFTLIILALLVFVIKVVLATMRRPELFAPADHPSSPVLEIQPSKSSGLVIADTEKQKILERLLVHMQADRPYLVAELTLDELAAQLAIKPKLLSLVINDGLKQNFFDFINRYRIEEAKKLLTNPPDKKITVLEVLYEVGFNSKSSFNTLFKKHTGLTPTEFKRKHQAG